MAIAALAPLGLTSDCTLPATRAGDSRIGRVEMILHLAGGMYDIHAPYYALFLVGPAANLIEIWWNARRPTARSTSATA